MKKIALWVAAALAVFIVGRLAHKYAMPPLLNVLARIPVVGPMAAKVLA